MTSDDEHDEARKRYDTAAVITGSISVIRVDEDDIDKTS